MAKKATFPRLATARGRRVKFRNRREVYDALDGCVTEAEFAALQREVAQWILDTWAAPKDLDWAMGVARDLWTAPVFRTPAPRDDP